MKLLVWLVLLLLIVLAVRSKVRNLRQDFNKASRPRPQPAPAPRVLPPENMVACAYCQLYLPASEALFSDANGERQYFCCQEHQHSACAGSA